MNTFLKTLEGLQRFILFIIQWFFISWIVATIVFTITDVIAANAQSSEILNRSDVRVGEHWNKPIN